jgi:hypothetical protein
MVAFELARYFETIGNTADAGRWYLTAAERFRRADWKTKAQESATRLGATEPAEIPAPTPAKRHSEVTSAESGEENASPHAEASDTPSVQQEESASPTQHQGHRSTDPNRHRRGRRGVRDSHSSRREASRPASRDVHNATAAHQEPEERSTRSADVAQTGESSAEAPAAPSLRGRYGDPGLSSRLSQLEMNFRRLLSSTPTSLEEADKAPAGPGVWVLTDSELTSYYYVEPCQTLRVAIPNLLRGGSGRKGESIRPRLAEHLGIPESRVAKYLGEHCVVRWLQMDEDAAHFAHFLVAVLRPALNE